MSLERFAHCLVVAILLCSMLPTYTARAAVGHFPIPKGLDANCTDPGAIQIFLKDRDGKPITEAIITMKGYRDPKTNAVIQVQQDYKINNEKGWLYITNLISWKAYSFIVRVGQQSDTFEIPVYPHYVTVSEVVPCYGCIYLQDPIPAMKFLPLPVKTGP